MENLTFTFTMKLLLNIARTNANGNRKETDRVEKMLVKRVHFN